MKIKLLVEQVKKAKQLAKSPGMEDICTAVEDVILNWYVNGMITARQRDRLLQVLSVNPPPD